MTRSGFSLVELLVAGAIGAAVLTVGVLIYQNIVAGGRSSTTTYVTVPLGSTVMQNFYGSNETSLKVWSAPIYGAAIGQPESVATDLRTTADVLREKLWLDVSKSSAVFCLGRNGLNASRPTTITVPLNLLGRLLDTPETFRVQLASSITATAGTFVAYRGACTTTNATIFILQPSGSLTQLSVLAIYEIDIVPVASPSGDYVSVRRYAAGALESYYDVFFPSDASLTVAFSPLVVAFERSIRSILVEGSLIDRLKKANDKPFYFVWWPDPSTRNLKVASSASYPATDPRAAYAAMGGRTSLFFVIPMFPAL